jgi:hypothetical protein
MNPTIPTANELIKGAHVNSTAVFIGKGASLDNLKASDIPQDAVIFCINDSIHKYATLELKNICYVVQQDGKHLIDAIPPGVVCLVSPQSFKYCPLPKHIYNRLELTVTVLSRTIMVAIELAKLAGCKDFMFLAFDSCASGSQAYAKCAKTPFLSADYLEGLLTQKEEILRRSIGHTCHFKS